MRSNQKGVTLVEALAVLAILGFVLSGIMYLVNHTHQGVNKLNSRENSAREARTILNHMANAVRQGNATASNDLSNKIVLNLTYGDAATEGIKYTFDKDNKRLSYTHWTSSGTQNQVLSKKVSDITVGITADRISIKLTMLIPNNQTLSTSTVVYLPSL